MSELLLAYMIYGLAASATTFPMDPDGFMPLQHHYLLWKVVGFIGLATFQARWVVQWLHSEKHKESRVPLSFWWLSLVGSLLCLAYFLRQQDSVGIAGYLVSAVPYTRNLMLVYQKRRADELAALATATSEGPLK